MDRGIIALDETDAHRELLREAGEYAADSDAELLLLWYLDEAEYASQVDTLETVGEIEHVSYSPDAVTDAATEDARKFANDTLAELEVDYDIIVAVVEDGERAQTLVQAGVEHDCDHSFVVGESRSPTGKALFGDFAQRVLLDFDGYVTVHMR